MSDLTQELSERFTSSYRRLLAHDMRRELLGGAHEKLPPSEIAYLLSVASRLSLNANNDSELAGAQCQLAYDIAVRVHNFANGCSGVVAPLCEGILSRIGNFPARNLLRQMTADLRRIRDPFLELESLVRTQENCSEDAPEGVTLTDFQVRLLGALRSSATVSVSAPTSAGKSFTLELELLYRL